MIRYFQVIDNCKMCHYCSVGHNFFPQNLDSLSCETPGCSCLSYSVRGGGELFSEVSLQAFRARMFVGF